MKLCPSVRFSGKIQKQGNLPAECEDELGIFPEKGRFAVADGASEAIYSKIWAGMLVEAFGEVDWLQGDNGTLDAWLERCRVRWSEWKGSIISRELPWFTREKLELGSFATFLGISFDVNSVEPGHMIWRAVACGDSCLFLIQGESLRLSFPCETAEEFGNSPPLIPTLPYPMVDRLRVGSGSVVAGERVYLTTDAMAKWFLDVYEGGGKPWLTLDSIATEEDLERVVAECRGQQGMRNDDVALVTIEMVGEGYERVA